MKGDYVIKKKNKKKFKIYLFLFLLIAEILVIPYLALYIDNLLKNRLNYKLVDIKYLDSFVALVSDSRILALSIIMFVLIILIVLFKFSFDKMTVEKSDTISVTDSISIPVAVGEGQHGTSRFMTEDEISNTFYNYTDKNENDAIKQNLGLVIGKLKDKILCIVDDCHAIIVGATRSGKTRRMLLQTIWLRGKTGRSMVITDPKGELYLYSKDYLEKKKGYKVYAIDFRSPNKSVKYNYMRDINQSIDINDIPKAIDLTWDLVSVLVGEPKGEPLWTNGEASVIASCILLVATQPNKAYRNLTNVSNVIGTMCKYHKNESTGNIEMYITRYLRTLPKNHPSRMVFATAELSPGETQGSFFGSALATLRLFTNWNIADMTSDSEFEPKQLSKGKVALFIIIPDDKKTFNSLASLLINQIYVSLVEVADSSGGVLPITVEFLLEEFGNLPCIPSFGSMLSVGGGRGMRFTLAVQDFQQIEQVYPKEYNNIKGNCIVWVYLKSPNLATLEEISKRTGSYTVQINSSSKSTNSSNSNNVNFSNSTNYQQRSLLMPDEVGRFESPYTLVLYSGKYPMIIYSPDITEYQANIDFDMGDKEHNTNLKMNRENERFIREVKEISLWDSFKEIAKREKQINEEQHKLKENEIKLAIKKEIAEYEQEEQAEYEERYSEEQDDNYLESKKRKSIFDK